MKAGHVVCDLDLVRKTIACLPFADNEAGLKETEIMMRLMLGEIESLRILYEACLEAGRRRSEYPTKPEGMCAQTAKYIFDPIEDWLVAHAEVNGRHMDEREGLE